MFENNAKSLAISLKIESLFTPTIKRYFEVLSAVLFTYIVFWIEVTCAYIVYCMIVYGGTLTHLFLAGYFVFMYIDRKADRDCSRGQGSDFIRNLKCFKYFANYFPVKLIKTAHLTPDKNYLFACYPHGVIGCGYFSNFVTHGTNFHQLFPGIRSRLVSLTYHFYIPFYRELVLSWGVMSPKFNSIKNALSQSTDETAPHNLRDGYRSNAVVIVIGGAQEALYAKPGQYKIVIKKRKGFVKACIQTGASLVPVFSFGEVDVYDQIEGPMLRKFQEFMKRLITFSPVVFIGRSFLPIGGLPFRAPIHTVVGTPIEVSKNPTPSQSDIDNLHARFMEDLQKLFEEHKSKYLKDPQNAELIME